MPQPSEASPLGSPFIELQSVDSTNNYARQQIHAASLPDLPDRQTGRQGRIKHGTAFFAHEQVAGKGQRGKIWNSEKGANIALSIVIKPHPLLLTQQFQLSACVAVAVHDFFKKYSGDDAKIKWPNDLYWQDRKAGGILIENIVGIGEPGASSASTAAHWEWSIIGIGININQTAFPSFLPNPVSLKQITGKHFDIVSLAKEICTRLNKKFDELTLAGFDAIYQQYITHLYKRNTAIKLKKNNRGFEAVIKNVTRTGRLVVQHSIEEEFDFGEVEWVI